MKHARTLLVSFAVAAGLGGGAAAFAADDAPLSRREGVLLGLSALGGGLSGVAFWRAAKRNKALVQLSQTRGEKLTALEKRLDSAHDIQKLDQEIITSLKRQVSTKDEIISLMEKREKNNAAREEETETRPSPSGPVWPGLFSAKGNNRPN